VIHSSSALNVLHDSALERIEASLRRMMRSDIVRLHQGKTYFPPLCSPKPWQREEFDLLAHEHAPSQGVHRLRRLIAARLSQRYRRSVDPDDIVVTSGATHGISAALRCVIDHGAEVLVPSPQWLFAAGVIQAAGGEVVEVPVFLELRVDPAFDFVAALEEQVTSRTRALYFNNPNNPTGHSLDAEALARLIDLAERHDLWLISDNAYEDFDFSPGGFVDIASLPGGAERTYSVYTFSKSYAMPGHRVGYVVVPPGLAGPMVNSVLCSIYSVATASQFAAQQALETSQKEIEERQRLVLDSWRRVDGMLEIPHTRIDGGLYTFLDLSRSVDGADDFLDRCLAAGVSLAPGLAFGRHCSMYARLCFTAVPPERLHVGIERINRVWRQTAA
jgi:aspartate aminotransferase